MENQQLPKRKHSSLQSFLVSTSTILTFQARVFIKQKNDEKKRKTEMFIQFVRIEVGGS